MKTTTFASASRRAVITHQAIGFHLALYVGTQRSTGTPARTWSEAVRVARAWVGAQGRVIA